MDFPKVINFQIKKKLDKSICYSSYEAFDKAKDSLCILKILDKNVAKNEAMAKEFLSHAQILTGLKNEHICAVRGCRYDKENNNYYLINEHHDFQPLSAIILEKFSLSLEALLHIFIQICDTLRYANLYGVLHGLLNPNSIFINAEGKIKIDDFGFSWYIPALLKKDTKESRYLAKYIAPDYYQDTKIVDGRSDVYSIGLLLYEVISGKAPISGDSMDAITAKHTSVELPAINFKALDLPNELAMIISKATNKRKAQRYQNFKQIIEDLKKIEFKYIASPKLIEAPSFGEDEPDPIIDEEHPPDYNPLFPPFISRKLIYSGVGAVLFVFLILFVTNYIPLGNQDQPTFNEQAIIQRESNSVYEEEKEQKEKALPAMDAETEDLDKEPVANAAREQIAKDIEPTTPPDTKQPPAKTSVTIYVVAEDSPARADVFLENQYIGKTNAQGEIEINNLEPRANLNLRIVKEGYENSEKLLTLGATPETYRFSLKEVQQNLGKVVFTATPMADKIYIDGVLQEGTTPQTITLQSGKHQIAMVNSSLGLRHEQTINLRNEQTLRINHDFTVKQTGSVAVSLSNAAEFGFAYVYIDGKPWEGNSKTTPLEVELPVGVHKISVNRDGFTASPEEQVVNVESQKTKFVSFTLNRIGTN